MVLLTYGLTKYEGDFQISDASAWQGQLYDLLKNEFDVTQFS
jgi:hypothetical protein